MMLRHSLRLLHLLLALMLMSGAAHAAIEAYSFDNPVQEARYNKLIAELRCLVCQNQNLADSNAELAQDMRRKTYELVRAGKSEQEITDFMVTRYGDFVMYRPPVKNTTLLLWFGPLVIFLIALTIVVTYMRKQKQPQATSDEIPDQLQQKAHAILDDERSR